MRSVGPCNSKCLAMKRGAFLNCYGYSKKTKIQSHNLAAAILEGLMPITTEDEPEDVDDDAACRVCSQYPLPYLCELNQFCPSLLSASSTDSPRTSRPHKCSLL